MSDELSPIQAAFVKHLPLLLRSLVVGLFTLLGVAGAQVLWPGARMDALELRIQKVESSAIYTEGLAKLECERNWHRARLVLPCRHLLGDEPPQETGMRAP